MKIAFGIVTFRKNYLESPSYQALLNAKGDFLVSKESIFIYDNTDNKNWHIDKNNNVNYIHDSFNSGIPKAYNTMANKAISKNFDWIVFLDQDTILDDKSINQYYNSITVNPDIPIKSPMIYANNLLISPAKFIRMQAHIINNIQPGIHSLNKLTVINSGIMINLKFFQKIGGYNENLRLDFTDTEFVEKAKERISSFELLNLTFKQSFSAFTDNKEQSLFRYKIYLCDYRNYPYKKRSDRFFLRLVVIKHTIKLSLKFKSFDFIKYFFISHKHGDK